MIKDKNKYVPVLITRREYELYKQIVDNHNEKGIVYKDFSHIQKLSLSRLFGYSIRFYVHKITCDFEGWRGRNGKI